MWLVTKQVSEDKWQIKNTYTNVTKTVTANWLHRNAEKLHIKGVTPTDITIYGDLQEYIDATETLNEMIQGSRMFRVRIQYDADKNITECKLCEILSDVECEIPDYVTNMHYSVFFGNNLWYRSEITIPDSIVFIDCTGLSKSSTKTNLYLRKLTLSNSMEIVPSYLFSYYQSLEELVLPKGLKAITERAFYCCGMLDELRFPKTLTAIGQEAFYGCTHLKRMSKLPESMKYVGEKAFTCTGLASISFNEGLESIGDRAFETTKITRVSLPLRLRNLGQGVFKDCKKLRYADLSYWMDDLPDALFYGCIQLTHVELNDIVYHIKQSAFGECSKLKDFSLPKYLRGIGPVAFSGCTSLTELKFPETLRKIESAAFQITGLQEVHLPCAVDMEPEVFSECSKLRRVTFDACHAQLPEKLFRDCPKLQYVSFGEGLTEIGDDTFNGCRNIEELHLPESLEFVSLWRIGLYNSIRRNHELRIYLGDNTRVAINEKMPKRDLVGVTLYVHENSQSDINNQYLTRCGVVIKHYSDL